MLVIQKLALTKLAESGLSLKQMTASKMEALSAIRVEKLDPAFKKYPALKIPYFTIAGKLTGFYRIRYLGPMTGFDALQKKAPRYTQPSNTTSEVYLYPDVPWSDFANDPGKALYITEGELKAACACHNGFPTIGLGGVWSWRSAKRNMPLIPVLNDFKWEGRPVYIVFDSDFATKSSVMKALVALAQTLNALKARPYIVALPDLEHLLADGKKTGFDDYIASEGRKSFERLVMDAEPFDLAEELWKLNGEVVYIKNPGLIIVLADGRKISPAAFKEHAYSNRFYFEQQFDAKGNAKLLKKQLAPAWLQWEGRAELERITYAPGQDVVADSCYNYWPGWGCCPKKGDVSLWKTLLDYLFDTENDGRKWFEQWCAYPIQNPGAKLYTAAVLWGPTHGTGKSLVGYTLGKVYGRNFSEIDDQKLESSFNEWAQNKQFVMGDDVTGSEYKKALMDRIKAMISRHTISINAKYLPSYEIPDVINYYFTSNHPDAFLVEDTDRRYFIHQVPREPMGRDFYDTYDKVLHNGSLAPALFDYFMHLDLTGFNPKASAPQTAAKRSMIIDSKSDVAMWVYKLREAPEQVLKFGNESIKADLLTNDQLLRLYDPEAQRKVTANGLGRELKRAGFTQVNGGSVVMTNRGPQRLYIVRNERQWLKAKPAAIMQHYNSAFSLEAPQESKRKF